MQKTAYIIATMALLSGCVNVEKIKAENDAKDIAQCVSLGFTPRTEAFGNCRLQLMSIRAQRGAAAAAAFGAASEGYKLGSGAYAPK